MRRNALQFFSRGAPAALAAALIATGWATFALQSATAAPAARELPVRAEIEGIIRESGAEISVSFRTLDGRDALSIDADRVFHAASTMKIPVMIELYAQVKEKKARLDEPIEVKNQFASIVDGSPYQLDAGDDSDADVYKMIGKTMTLSDLCEHMITRSSNLATDLVIQRLGVENIRARVHRLHAGGMHVLRGVEDGKAFEKGMNNTTDAEALETLLEAIAKGKAVDAKSSRAMVDILARSEFHEAIPAGVPSGVRIAHKTGEITGLHHDAAIVFARRPFILVILLRGIPDRDKSSAIMAHLTRVIYDAAEKDVPVRQ